MSEPIDPSDLPNNSFVNALNQISHGQLSDQASSELSRLVEAVQDTGRKGKIVVSMTIKPRGRDSGQVEVSGEVKTTCPTHEVAPVMLFARDGQLVRDNPEQLKLRLGDKPRLVTPAQQAASNQ